MRLLVADKDGDDASALDVAEIARDYGKIISILEPLLFLLGITSPWMRWHSFLDLLDAELPPEDADPPTPSS